jgi:hypothetical protein
MFQMLQQVLHVASLFISRHVKSVRKGGPYVRASMGGPHVHEHATLQLRFIPTVLYLYSR